MSLLFVDSFDHYPSADVAVKWNNILLQGGGASAGVVTVDPVAGRRGGGALRIKGDAQVTKNLPGATTTIFGAAVKLTTWGNPTTSSDTIVALGGAADLHLYITASPDGSLQAYRKTGSITRTLLGTTTGAAISLNNYFYLEVKATIDAIAGKVKILVDGATVLNLINVNTLGPNSAGVSKTSRVVLSTPSTGASTDVALYDDLYIADDAGVFNNDFFGDVRVDVVRPNADGTYLDFTPSSGTAHFSLLNEAVPNATTSVASSTLGHKDSYQFTDIASIVGQVRGVQIVDAALKDDAGLRSLAHLAKSGASEQQSAAMPLSTDRKYYMSIHETDPATGTAWSQTSINAAEFGIVVAV